MKKLMIAAAIVCAAVMAQAASFDWKTAGSNTAKTFYGKNGSSTIAGYTVYLFATQDVTQDAILTQFRKSGTLGSYTAAASTTLDSNSRIASTVNFSKGDAGDNWNYYMVVMDGAKDIFIGNTVAVQGQSSAASPVSFSGVKTATQNLMGEAKSFSDAGWYKTADVPEPTSAMLLLLGVAGLALKRKQK